MIGVPPARPAREDANSGGDVFPAERDRSAMVVPDRVADRIADAPLSAHLATSVEDRPHVAPVWYAYEDGSLWVTTGGKKRRNLRRNPRVAVSIESADRAGNVDWNATLLATARVVEDDERETAVLARMDRKYGGGAEGEDDREPADGGDHEPADDDREPTDGGDHEPADGDDHELDGGEEPVGALVELRVASATLTEY